MDSEEPPNVRVACSGDIDEVVRLMHDAAAWMSAKGTPAWDVARIDRTFAETFVLRSELLGIASENGIYGHSRFCNTDFDDKLACLNLSGVWMGFYSRASMSSAPDEPPENIRLQWAFPFYRFLNRPVGR
nr:hypothetical protein [Providencia sp. 21OH12SH02B-Prov]